MLARKILNVRESVKLNVLQFDHRTLNLTPFSAPAVLSDGAKN